MEYISRTIQPLISEAMNIFPVVTICGPRQSGKTTLCRREFPHLRYVNLEDATTRMFAVEDIKGFLENLRSGAIIDEVQLVPEIFSQLQVMVDENRFRGADEGRFILTGSSNFAFMPQLRQSLAGRTGIYTLLPLSTAEICQKDSDASTDNLIINGGYPRVWDNGVSHREAILNGYIDTYVERDVMRFTEVRDLHKFRMFVRLCAARIGSELNKSSLAVELGVSVPTVERWLSVLEATYIVHLLQPWFENIGKRLVKTPKLYFTDTGVACRLLGINTPEHLTGHPLRGALFENMVVNDLLKRELNTGQRRNLYYYRDKTGHEVDIVLEEGGKLSAFEIKAGKSFNTDYLRNIRYLKRHLGERLHCSAVIYDGDAEMLKNEESVINYRNV